MEIKGPQVMLRSNQRGGQVGFSALHITESRQHHREGPCVFLPVVPQITSGYERGAPQ